MAELESKGSSSKDMASTVLLKTAKKELRALMKHKLSNISAESVKVQSNAIFTSVTTFQPYQEAKRVGIYLSMPTSEVQTDAIVRHALESGKKVFVPYLHKAKYSSPNAPRSVMEMVDLRSLSDYDLLKRDNWGIPTIGADTVDQREHILENSSKESEGLDMILMPGVAFDVDPEIGFVRRLGHGKGFYDLFLHRYRGSRESHESGPPGSPGTGVLLFGLALEEQFLGSNAGSLVPVGEHDSLLHGLAVGNGKLLVGPIKRE